MFVVKLDKARYAYDVYALVKAFFPRENVKIMTSETGRPKKKELVDGFRIRMDFEGNGDVRLLYCETPHKEGGGMDLPRTNDTKTYVWSPVSEGRQDFSMEAEQEPEAAYKNAFKRFLYRSLCDITGKELPWGNLTGIRPTKLVLGMLEAGKEEDEILDFMRERHYVSGKKLALSLDIARRERKILSTLHGRDGYSLYIGIPFCPTTCLYCSFTSYPIGACKNMVEAYIDCLIREMTKTAEIQKGKILDTVYIGGGTPTTLEAYQLERLIVSMKDIFDFSTVQEFTVEAGRADSITEEKLGALYRQGVTRISVNPQTMREETLKFIGRQATAEQTREAFLMARKLGFDNINMDMIVGLPTESAADVAGTVEKITALNPDSLTVHSLAVKRASRLRQCMEENRITLPEDGWEMMEIAARGAKQMDMHPYYLYRQKNITDNLENVGFAREGKYGIYNILIMEEKQTIIACGAGSITKRVYPDGRIKRCENVKDVALYIEKIDEMIERKKQLFCKELFA